MKSLAYAIGLSSLLSPGISSAQEVRENLEIESYRQEVRANAQKILSPLGLKIIPHKGISHRSIHVGFPLIQQIPVGNYQNQGQLHLGLSATRWKGSAIQDGIPGNKSTQVQLGISFSVKGNLL